MSHFGDYMDDVPVKISEKYKRPPRIELPFSVTDCPARAKKVVESARYSTTFERNVLAIQKELRSAKGIKRSERRHRLQLLEEAKQKKLDVIAAEEAAEKLKQLSVSDVSYPSTDEISAPDDRLDKACNTSPTENNSPEVDAPTNVNYTCPTTEPQPDILQPIQVQQHPQQNNLLDDPDPLQELQRNSKIAKPPQYNRNVETLTFRDFEHDTSSPFDNVELKTINDMELLAQVLQSQRESAASCPPQPPYNDQPYPEYANCGTQAQGVAFLSSAYIEQPVGTGIIYTATPHYPVANGYFIPEPVCETIPIENVYVPNYHYLVPATPFPVAEPYYNLPSTSAEAAQVPNGSSYIPHPYYFHYPHVPMHCMEHYNTVEAKALEAQKIKLNHNPQMRSSTQGTVKSRSRSVSDIIRELNDELSAARQRDSDKYTCLPGSSRSGPNSERKVEKRYWKKIERLPNPLHSLSPTQQRMCQNIHAMGFPLDRVARICSLLGDNDKKVIEGLLILGEIMDLGFTESKAAAALVKHQFNRDKALDELVS